MDQAHRHGSSDRGFTLVEILIAIVLVGILTAVAVIGVGSLTSKGSSASCQASLDAARTAVTSAAVSNSTTPSTFTDLLGGTNPGLSVPSGVRVSTDGRVMSGSGWSLLWQPVPSGGATLLCATPSDAWTPSVLPLRVWLDAAAADTITLAAGVVSRWADRSGNARDAVQATAALRPSLDPTGFSGRPAVRFATDRLDVPGAAAPVQGGSIFVVTTPNATGSNSTGIVNIDSSPSDDPEHRLGLGGQSVTYWNSTYVAQGITGTTPSVAALTYTTSGVSTTATVWRTGNQVATGSQTGTWKPIQEFSLGGYVRINGYRNGVIAEVVVTGLIDTATRQRIEGYLAWKWGVQTDLPDGHPYRTAPPSWSDA